MDVQTFVNQLAQLAEKSPEARAFILAFTLELLLLVAFVAYFLQRVVNRRRQVEAEDDVTNPTAELAVAMSRVSDALLVFANSFTPTLKAINESTQATEAGVAGIRAETLQRKPVDTAILESQDVLAQAIERLQKSVAAIRTRDDAALMNTQLREDIKTDTALTVQPVLAKLTSVDEAVASVPPRLDALKVKMDELPSIVKEAYVALVSERNAEREQKEQAQAALATFQKQNADLTAQLMARDTTIADQTQLIADLRETAARLKAQTTAETKPDVQPEPAKNLPVADISPVPKSEVAP